MPEFPYKDFLNNKDQYREQNEKARFPSLGKAISLAKHVWLQAEG